MAKPVEIGARSFRPQNSALEHYKALLHRYQDGQRVSDQGDHADLVALIERYDPVLDAVGEPTKGDGQIAHFERRLNTGCQASERKQWARAGAFISGRRCRRMGKPLGHRVAIRPVSAPDGRPRELVTLKAP